VSHNIVSNIKAGKGVAPVLRMLERGVDVGLGTDGPMSGNTLDMMGLLGYTAKLQKLAQLDRRAMPAKTVVAMATIGGARAIHLQDRIGSLEEGKLPTSHRRQGFGPRPRHDVYSPPLRRRADVRSVIVNGRLVVTTIACRPSTSRK
jgi:cytosine/adenosine deaminase-related metal-dependent hydrolase